MIIRKRNMMRSSGERQILLLGPQRHQQGVAKAISDLGVSGTLATVTAGWEEREHEDTVLSQDLDGRTRNLGLYPRAEDVYVHDSFVRTLIEERHDRLRQLQELYRFRLAPQLQVCRALLARTKPGDPDSLLDPEIDSAIDGVRALDQHHLDRISTLEAEIAERLADRQRPSIEHHRVELARTLDEADALLVAGGNVGTLLTLLRLFDVFGLADTKPVVAWSGGAMVLTERVVLFHDNPPQGPGDAELYGPGLGLVTGLVPLPHARHRLQLDDLGRVALFARRFAPASCVTLDYGGRIDRSPSPDRWQPSGGACVLGLDGRVEATVGSSTASEWPNTDLGSGIDLKLRDPAVESETTLTSGPSPVVGDANVVISDLTNGAHNGRAALDRALDAWTFPVVGDGWALFVYRGSANEVKLQHWVSGLPSALPFQPIPGTELWVLETDIQHEARIEYKFEIVRGNGRELIRDPLNDTMAHDPFGANSVVQGLGYARPPWTHDQPTTRKGEVVDGSVASTVFGQNRPYSVYLPARFRETRRYPLLIVHDGMEYAHYAALVTVLDNMIHRLEIPPLVAALIQSPERTTEYGADDRHARFLVDELVPALEGTFPLLSNPRDRGLVGASLGAVASLHTAWSHPGSFGKLLLQSGSFAFTDIGDHDLGPVFDPVVEFVNQFRKDPGRPAGQVFLSAGIYESLIYFNRSLLPVFQETGADVRLVEAHDGHNWENWRDQLREGLTWLFPGPLWMDYE
ncbi:MAG: hypothetical protein GY773_20605 [Actinomycetia bacterium]|nr:hypothetical protein [Actinomycetes bacterium]